MSRKGESIYKRKDGRWEARYVKEIGADGQKKYASVYADSYKSVKAKRQLYMYDFANKNSSFTQLTIGDIAKEWLYVIKSQIKPSSYIKYEGLSNNHIINQIGALPLKKITSASLQSFTSQLKEKGRKGGGELSDKTVNDVLIILSLIFSYAQEEYSVSLPKIKSVRSENKEARVMTKDEQQRLCAYCLNDTDNYKLGILLALYTGMRIGELCALKWLDITDSYITVNKTMQRLKTDGGDTDVFISSPKSDSSKRIIPLPDFLKEIINKKRKLDGYVLKTERKAFCEPRTMQHRFKKTADSLRLEGVTFHTLRHTFATRCIEAGFDVKTLSEILGHSDVKITLNRYVHSSFELKQKNMQKLTGALLI